MKLKPGVVVHNFGDSYVAYDTTKSLMHELNESGYVILKAIQDKETRQRLVARFAEHFAISPDQAKEDVNHFLATLKSIEVIE